jgi:hypothetical protein
MGRVPNETTRSVIGWAHIHPTTREISTPLQPTVPTILKAIIIPTTQFPNRSKYCAKNNVRTKTM